MTVARVWIASIDQARADEYERFARDVSLPMFRRQPGFAGALMFRDGGDCVVLTLWEGKLEADALAASPAYRNTLAEIEGLITGSNEAELFEVHLAELAGLGTILPSGSQP